MNTLRVLYHLFLSDFRERTRRYSFLVVLGVTMYVGYLITIGDISLKFDRAYRGIYNSAWIGAEVTLVVTFMLSLFGFFLIQNSIERDTHTGVGQIIATTPLKRTTYLFGKWISHFMLLSVMVVILAIASLILQLLNSEDALDWGDLLLPFLVIGLPMMALTAGLAVLFESISWLRGSVANLVYFGLWMLTAGGLLNAASAGAALFPDPFGFGALIPGVRTAFLAQVPDAIGYFTLNFKPGGGAKLIPFQWDGVVWTANIFAFYGAYFLLGIALSFAGGLFFERFDPSRRKPLRLKFKGKPHAQADGLTPEVAVSPAPQIATRLTPLSSSCNNAAYANIFVAEIKLLVKGHSWWWYAVVLALIAGCLFAPLETAEKLLLVAWVWPILFISSLGCREQLHETRQIVYSAARPLWTQLPATWLAGVAITAVLGIGAALAFLARGEWALLASWLAAALFIPSLALALGVWSGTNKLFEIIFVFWSMCALQRIPGADFIHAPAPLYLGITAVLLVTAVVGRATQLKK